MASYEFKARNAGGELVADVITADSERAVMEILDRRGLFPVEIREKTAAAGRSVRAGIRGRVKTDELVAFARQLADLLKVGITLNKALDALARQTPESEFGRILDNLRADVASGTPLSQAMEKFPRCFNELFVSMVEAGEAGGFIEESLERVASFSEQIQELKSRVRAAMAYPILLSVLGTATVVFLLVFFIPRFTQIFSDMGGALPWPTLVLIGVSNFMQSYGIFLLAALVVLGFIGYRVLGTDSGKLAFDRVKLKIPAVGPVFQKAAIARFARILGTLLKSGVSILDAIEITRKAVGNRWFGLHIEEAYGQVKEGKRLAEPLRGYPEFPRIVVDMIAVGEETGSMEDVLVKIADNYDRQVDRAVKVLVSLMEPLMLIFMGGVVGAIVISMLLPVFTLQSIVK